MKTYQMRANECFKENNGDCIVEASNTIRLHPEFCNYCEKLKSKISQLPFKKERSDINLKSKEIEIPNGTIKKFKYPYLLASYPFLKDKNKFLTKYKGEETLLNQVFSMYGDYKIFSYRDPKLMDIKVSLADIYLSDYFKSIRYEISIKEFLDLLKLESTGYYRSEILKSQHYLKNTTFITPIINFKTGEKSGIHEWSILAEFKFQDKEKRKYYFEILLGDSFYKGIYENKYTLLELEKVLDLSKIALNLYLFLIIQSPYKLSKYPKDFEELKIAIGITDTNLVRAKKTIEKAWNDIKDRGLLKGYRHSKIFISKKDNREKIKFSKQRELIP